MKTKTITFNVTAGDISHGVRGDCKACPIARSVYRRIRTGVIAKVYGSFLDLRTLRGKLVTNVQLPTECDTFVQRFDRNNAGPRQRVRPFSFKADIPTKFLAAA